ncbi:MAG: hypothetical protein S0880_35880 [Actinomycetota bacterium]|nr:hypothetical protein [Actinomycetota bacterium]
MAVLTVIVSLVISTTSPPHYSLEGAVLLVGPSRSNDDVAADEEINETNRLLGFTTSLGTVAETLNLLVSGQETRAQLEAEGLTSSFEIETDDRSPIIRFEVTDTDPVVAEATLDGLMDRVAAELARSQDVLDTAPETRISLQTIASSSEPTVDTSDRRRALLLLLGSGALATSLVTVAADAALRGGAAGRGRGAAEEPGADPAIAAHQLVHSLVPGGVSPAAVADPAFAAPTVAVDLTDPAHHGPLPPRPATPAPQVVAPVIRRGPGWPRPPLVAPAPQVAVTDGAGNGATGPLHDDHHPLAHASAGLAPREPATAPPLRPAANGYGHPGPVGR